MTKDEILWEVTLLFRDTLDVPNLVLRPETTAKDVEQWDSLTHVCLWWVAHAVWAAPLPRRLPVKAPAWRCSPEPARRSMRQSPT